MTPTAQGPAASLDPFIVSGDAGFVIYRAGDRSTDLFVIQRGRVELTDEGGGAPVSLELGDVFGERALFDRLPRDHTARAVTPFALVRLDAATFEAVVQLRPDIALHVLRVVIERAGDFGRPAPRRRQGASTASEHRTALVHEPSGSRFPLTPGRDLVIGRRDKATGAVPDLDLTDIDTERTLSRRHLRLTWRENTCFAAEATKTANGSFINGRKLESSGPVQLQRGDRIRLGIVELVFEG